MLLDRELESAVTETRISPILIIEELCDAQNNRNTTLILLMLAYPDCSDVATRTHTNSLHKRRYGFSILVGVRDDRQTASTVLARCFCWNIGLRLTSHACARRPGRGTSRYGRCGRGWGCGDSDRCARSRYVYLHQGVAIIVIMLDGSDDARNRNSSRRGRSWSRHCF